MWDMCMWDAERQKVRLLTDGSGREVDDGIVDTVVCLRLLGVNTTSSCWGHAQRITGGPYVVFGHAAATRFQNEYKAIGIRSSLEYKRLRQEATVLNMNERLKVLVHLDRFYAARNVAFADRIVITSVDAEAGRLQCQGSGIAHILEPVAAADLLAGHRREMTAFTKYLRSVISCSSTIGDGTRSGDS